MKSLIKAALILFVSSTVWAQPQGVVVVAGGGEEGDPGDKSAWNYELYGRLVKNGDTNGDKKLKVVVMSYYEQDDHYKKTFKALGADEVEAVELTKRSMATDPKILKKIKDADVVFFRGGDQAEYYKNIKNTPLKKELLNLKNRGGAFGGTSAGAMSLAGYSLAGGQELGSDDTLSNSHSPLLQDAFDKKKSSIKDDFLGIVPNVTIDTHCGERSRIGRIMGTHAKATQDFKKNDMIGICVADQTGIAISGGKAEVYGNGVVEVIKQTPDTIIIRKPGHPLTYTDIELNALTEGWKFDVNSGQPLLDQAPAGVKKVSAKPKCASIEGEVEVAGSAATHSTSFEFSPAYEKGAFKLQSNSGASIRGVIGVTQSQSYDKTANGNSKKAEKLAAIYRSFYDHPNASAILASDQSIIRGKAGIATLSFERAGKKEKEISSLIIDCGKCTHVGLSPRESTLNGGTQAMKLSAIVGARVHVIGESNVTGVKYNVAKHKIEAPRQASEGDYCVECSANKNHALEAVKELAQAAGQDSNECEK